MGRAKTEKFPIFAGFSLDPKTNKMSAGYIIGISIKPADFGLTGSEDNATMAAAVVKSLEAQGAAEATARAEAAEQRAEAAEAEVARLRGDRKALASMWLMTLPPGPLATVLPSAPDAMRVLGGGLIDVTGEDIDTAGLIVYMRDLLARMLAEAQPAEVTDG